jgi:hypothetical protein
MRIGRIWRMRRIGPHGARARRCRAKKCVYGRGGSLPRLYQFAQSARSARSASPSVLDAGPAREADPRQASRTEGLRGLSGSSGCSGSLLLAREDVDADPKMLLWAESSVARTNDLPDPPNPQHPHEHSVPAVSPIAPRCVTPSEEFACRLRASYDSCPVRCRCRPNCPTRSRCRRARACLHRMSRGAGRSAIRRRCG